MDPTAAGIEQIDRRVTEVFALVSEALSRATDALLGGGRDVARSVVDDDQVVDDLVAELELAVWDELNRRPVQGEPLRHLVAVLLILPELERSADLAEHIAQRAANDLGSEMSPLSRGIVQQMTEVAVEMWQMAADAYVDRTARSEQLAEADVGIDILHDRLTREVAAEAMSVAVGAQVTLLARFYERLGDHAVNLARRIEMLPPRGADGSPDDSG